MPEQLDGALAPGTRDDEGMIEIPLGVEMLEDVDEDFGGEI